MVKKKMKKKKYKKCKKRPEIRYNPECIFINMLLGYFLSVIFLQAL